MVRGIRWALVATVIAGIVGTDLGCTLGYLLAAIPLIDQAINRLPSDRTTRYIYRVQSSGAGNTPISGADIKLFALRRGGDFNNPSDYETVADAHRVTNTDGEAQVNVATSPNQPDDNVIQPANYYREVIAAPGFSTYTGVREPITEGQGPRELDPIRLVPLGP